jgi:hypothetical protein
VAFASGAVWVGDWGIEPDPADVYATLSGQREYLIAKEKAETATWEAARRDAIEVSSRALIYHNLPPCSPERVEELKRGQERIARIRAERAAVEAALAQEPGRVAERQRLAHQKDMLDRRAAEQRGVLNELKGLTI